jgi:osmotically inducible lipoprotein OsmB
MEESQMSDRVAKIVIGSALALSLAACGSMTTRERDTAVGAGLGAAAGAAITGDVGGAVGGGVIGGVIGNQVGRDREERYERRSYGRRY